MRPAVQGVPRFASGISESTDWSRRKLPAEIMSTGYKYLEPQALARVKNLQLAARGVVEGSITGLHASPNKGFSIEFAEHREYVSGDDPRHLDFKMLAKTERLYIKQYEEETNMRVQIILDTSASMGYKYSTGISKYEYGCYLTAILAYMMTRQQDSVGLTAFDTEIRLDMPAHSSPRHFHEMMERLEMMKPGQQTGIASTLHLLANRFKKRCLIVLISDLYDEQEEIMRALHHFVHSRHEVIVFNIFDKAELEFPFEDTVAFHDLETKERILVEPDSIRNAYLQEVRKFTDSYQKLCRESGIDYILTDTTIPYDYMLTRYVAKRFMIQS